MKFALVDGNLTEATKGAKGVCPICDSEVFAKCGDIRVNHWSHRGDSNCDYNGEKETEWHLFWKGNYPDKWQEVLVIDEQTGKKRFADVRTSHGLVIEFQHSYIDLEERTKRENFYKDMIWVVDGTRLKWDYPRFLKGIDDFRKTRKKGCYIVNFPDEYFPSTWLGSTVPVFFDFLGTESLDTRDPFREQLYCLLPQEKKRKAILLIFPRESFIKSTLEGKLLRKKQKPQNQNLESPSKKNIVRRRRESTHYYDPKKGRLVKKWRF